jgi:hypothetical protein
MRGFGCNDKMLNRLIIRCRDPKLIALVKLEYQQLFGQSLYDRVSSETGGNHRKLLLSVLRQ